METRLNAERENIRDDKMADTTIPDVKLHFCNAVNF